MASNSRVSQVSDGFASVRRFLRHSVIQAGYHVRPACLIIGAQKSGTTALAHYLSAHPNVISPTVKEIHFFDREIAYAKGLPWYCSHFPLPHRVERGDVAFEATPAYLYSSEAARRIYDYDPGVKLVALLRDPVERAYSHWNMHRIIWSEDSRRHLQFHRDSNLQTRRWMESMIEKEIFPDFDEVVREELDMISSHESTPEPSYVRRGLYFEQLSRYFDYFDREQFLILDSGSLRQEPLATMESVIQFLDLPSYDWSGHQFADVHVRPYQAPIVMEVESILRAFYRTHNQRLYEILHEDFGWG